MTSKIAADEYSILLLSAFLFAARAGVVEQLSFNCIATSFNLRGALLRVPMPLAVQ